MRRLRRTRLGSKKAAAAAVVVAVLVVAIGLFIKSYHDSGPTSPQALPTNTPSQFEAGLGTNKPSPTSSKSGAFLPAPGAVLTLPETTLSGVVGGGLTFAPGSVHQLTITVSSAVAVQRVGYIIPTSNDHSYGDVRVTGDAWSLTTTVYGRPAYALVFIESGPAGVPITCKITVDGRTSSQESSHGPYGRQICLG